MTEDEKFDAVILCNGDFPTHPKALAVLREAKFLCCCDGAAESCIAHGIRPDAIVGDGDSLDEELKRRNADILHIIHEQEFNDMTKATRFCIANGKTPRIAYVGATGKREDHTLGNIFLLPYYLTELKVSPVMLTDHGMFIPMSGTHTFGSFARQQVSIFNMSCGKLSSEGLRWQCYPYRQMWQGTLNEATGGTFTINADGAYIIYQTYGPKTSPEEHRDKRNGQD